MQQLRVLCVRKSADDNYKLSAQRSLQSILDALRRRMEVKEIWIVLSWEQASKKRDDIIDVYDAFSFSDGEEVIRILRPDIVIISNDYEYIQRSILKAAAHKGIPTVCLVSSAFGIMELSDGSSRRKVVGTLQLLKDHPMSIIKRYSFLIKTLFRTGYGLGHIARTIAKDIYLPFVPQTSRYRFGGGDLNIVSTPLWEDFLVKIGIDRRRVVVTGDISMDAIHQKLADMNQEPTRHSHGKIEILFITSPMVEHGLWSEDMRVQVVTGVVTIIREQLREDANLRVKIHPTSESLDVYVRLIHSIDKSVEIIQKADLLPLINNSDIVVCFGHSSAMLEAVLLRKPLIIMNLFNEGTTKNYYLREKIAKECRSTGELLRFIKDKNYTVVESGHLDAFLTKYFYLFDGMCSERAANHIISLLVKQGRAVSQR